MAQLSSAPVPLKSKRCTLERAEKFISDTYFTDCNLYGKLFPEKHPVRITHRKVRGRVPFEEATKGWSSASSKSKYPPATEVKPGSSYGPTWATHWFRVEIQIPKAWNKQEVHLLWNSNSEAMVWSPAGEPLQGLNKDDRISFILTCPHSSLKYDHVYIEMACNKILGAGKDLVDAPIMDLTFTLSQAELALFNRDAYELMMDVEVLVDMVKHLPDSRERGYQALYTVNRMMNACSADQPQTYQAARDICKKFLEQRNGDSAHTIHAIGNAHIDSAWLWPYAETKRKVARTWANVLSLAEDYPQLNFAFSQAQQFQWVKKTDYPSLYKKIQEMAKRGRFIPVGGCWVEMDGNLPSGESFVRQVLYGQRFFKEEFGSYCTEYWLPDTFGYSAQLPQILAGGGMKRFVTQKMSWCIVNKFPHNTFWWQGIDGTKCLAHFPPTDTYHARVKVEECLKNAKNHQDKGRSDHSLMLYGFGDGGGGPNNDMLERMQRLKDVDGIPRVKPSTPKDFFATIEKDSDHLCTWEGELYLELHQGTFTTQAEIKRQNRKLEHKFQQVEFLSVLQPIGKEVLTQKTISEKWKRLLLHQFHDVLPGSCIREVVEDATTDMKALNEELDAEKKNLVKALNSAHSKGGKSSSKGGSKVICNNLSWDRTEVIDLRQSSTASEAGSSSDGPQAKKVKRMKTETEAEKKFALVSIPAMSVSNVAQCSAASKSIVPAQIKSFNGGYKLWNEHLVAFVDSCGRLSQMNLSEPGWQTKGTEPVYQKPDVIPDGGHYGNQFVMFDDVPLYWDAWDVMDYHLETRKPVSECPSIEVVENNPLQVCLKVGLKISKRSSIEQRIVLRAHSKYLEFHTKVHWDESHKFLKVEFPVNAHSPEATFDIQFGHLKRPTHQNTSWDWARYEVVGHKWIDLSQYDWGVAILNDCKYGHSVIGNVMRISLLRSPKKPDPEADIGDHIFSYAIMPHTGTYQSAGVIQAAYEFNNPLAPIHLPSETTLDLREIITMAPSSVIIESVKKSEERNNCVIVRCYEAYGGEVVARLTTKLKATKFTRCNFLEEEDKEAGGFLEETSSSVSFKLKPFQIATVKIQL